MLGICHTTESAENGSYALEAPNNNGPIRFSTHGAKFQWLSFPHKRSLCESGFFGKFLEKERCFSGSAVVVTAFTLEGRQARFREKEVRSEKKWP